jgi:drug/metabolite transporter (DMT)-like permease
MTDSFGASRAGAWTGLMALVAMWGSAFALANLAAREIPPLWIAAGRLWCGAAFVYAVLRARHEGLPSPRQSPGAWRSYTIIGLFGAALPFSLYAWGAAHTQSALLGITNGGSPIFTGVLTALFIPAEPMPLRRWLGIGLGFVGLVALVWPEASAALHGLAASHMSFFGLLAGIAATFCYASANIITRRAPEMSATAAAVIFCSTGALACTLTALLASPLPAIVSWQAWACVVALGMFPTGIASILYVWIIRAHGPVFSSLATYIVPLWATGIGVLFLGEHIGLNAMLALLLIISGVAVASRR